MYLYGAPCMSLYSSVVSVYDAQFFWLFFVLCFVFNLFTHKMVFSVGQKGIKSSCKKLLCECRVKTRKKEILILFFRTFVQWTSFGKMYLSVVMALSLIADFKTLLLLLLMYLLYLSTLCEEKWSKQRKKA